MIGGRKGKKTIVGICFSFRSKEEFVSFKRPCPTLRSSERLSVLVSDYNGCPARRPAIYGGEVVKPAARCPGRISPLPVDGHRRPRSAYQRQPRRAPAVPARRHRRRHAPVSRRSRCRGTGADEDRKSRDAARERLQAATTGARDVIGQRATTLHRVTRGR